MKILIVLSALILFTAGCDRHKVDPRILSYIIEQDRAEALGKEYLESGTNASSQVWLSFNNVFPYHSNEIGLKFDPTTQSWEAAYVKSGLWWDRYLVDLSIPLSISSNLSSLQEKPIKVMVTPLKSINKHADGRLSFSFTGPTLELNQAEWSQLSTNPISLAKFGMTPITNQPVAMASKVLEVKGAPPK